MASKGYVNKDTRILADNVNAPHIFDEGGVTDTVSEHIVDIIDDHKEELIATAENVGLVKAGSGLSIDENGALNVTASGGLTLTEIGVSTQSDRPSIRVSIPYTNFNQYKFLYIGLFGGNGGLGGSILYPTMRWHGQTFGKFITPVADRNNIGSIGYMTAKADISGSNNYILDVYLENITLGSSGSYIAVYGVN